MAQKITLSNNGVIVHGRMRPANVAGGARHTPAIRLSRLHQLLKSQCPSICVVRGEGIGDVLMTTPTIRALKMMFDKVNITFATNTRYLDGALVKTLTYNPDISHIIERELMDELTFDLVVNLHCPAVNHEKRGKFPPNRIDLFAAHAGVKLSDPVPKFYIQKEEVDSGEIILERALNDKLILVQPFSSSKTRSSPHVKLKQAMIEMYQKYGIRSVIITHSSDGKTDVLWDNIPGSIFLRDVDIRGIAGVMVHCDLVLCPDSSILHLAGALGIPTVSLFGPTPPQSRINHYKNAVALWEGSGLGPCPCWYDSCLIRYTCWERLTTRTIVDKCLEHLGNTSRVDIQKLLERTKPIEIETEVM